MSNDNEEQIANYEIDYVDENGNVERGNVVTDGKQRAAEASTSGENSIESPQAAAAESAPQINPDTSSETAQTPPYEKFLDNKRIFLLVVGSGLLVLTLLSFISTFRYGKQFYAHKFVGGPSESFNKIVDVITYILSYSSIAALAYYCRRNSTLIASFVLMIVTSVLSLIFVAVRNRMLSSQQFINYYNSLELWRIVVTTLGYIGSILIYVNIFKKRGLLRKQYWLFAYVGLFVLTSILSASLNSKCIARFNEYGIMSSVTDAPMFLVFIYALVSMLSGTRNLAITVFLFLKKDSDIPPEIDIIGTGEDDGAVEVEA